MYQRMKKLIYSHLPKHRLGVNMVLSTLLLTLCLSFIPARAQACCYQCGIIGNWAYWCCTDAAECTAGTDGCTVTVLSNGDFGISCPGGYSVCGVRAINCCALYPGSAGCIADQPDLCDGKSDDPCCPDPVCCGDPCCGSKCCPTDIPSQTGG